MLPTDAPSSSTPVTARVESSWLASIRRLALALNRSPSLSLLLIKSALKPADHRHLNEIETDERYINAINFALEGALCAYVVKVVRTLRQKFGVNEMHKELLVEECLTLKTRMAEVEGTMKDTLESLDKFQVDLDAALASRLGLENQAKSAKDQVAYCNTKFWSYKLKLRRLGLPPLG